MAATNSHRCAYSVEWPGRIGMGIHALNLAIYEENMQQSSLVIFLLNSCKMVRILHLFLCIYTETVCRCRSLSSLT